jgi:hypothetical protein
LSNAIAAKASQRETKFTEEPVLLAMFALMWILRSGIAAVRKLTDPYVSEERRSDVSCGP